jgi:hypothetical protein
VNDEGEEENFFILEVPRQLSEVLTFCTIIPVPDLMRSRKSSPDVYFMARWTSVHRKGCLCKRCRPKENPRADDALSQDISLVLDE